MLNLVFGRENVPDESRMILDTRIYFSRNKRPEWFENEFVKNFLKVVDNTEVLFEEALKDYRGRGISTEMISTGCKTLCDIYYSEDSSLWFYGSAMGNNCIPFLHEIVKDKDINLFYEHYPDSLDAIIEDGLLCMNGSVVDWETYDDAYTDWCEENERLVRQAFEESYNV